MKKYCILHRFLLPLAIVLIIGFGRNTLAQQTGPPGIQFVMVSFDQPPTSVTVEKAALRYNKSFALSFHTDDGIEDVFTVGFPFLTGINTQGTNYPGLFYTDGCGNDISFKLSNSLFSYSGFNNEDMHQPGNFYNAVTWPQLALMYQNGCGIYNHGFTSDAFTDPAYMSYSIRRNESFIRRRLFDVTPGGVRTGVLVNPNGATDYTAAAFQEGYRVALRMGAFGILPDNGGDVNALTNWNQNLELNRVLAESVNVQQLADQLATSSIDGVNKWMPVFTHRIIEDYPQNLFFADFNYIAQTYGKNGLDNIWMASEEEVVNYLVVRDAVEVNHIVSGNVMLISFSGQVPGNLRFYPLSIVVNADASITGITINGGTANTYNGIGQTTALINLNWDGKIIPDLLDEVESNVSYAEQNPSEYNALIAMDYVLMLPDGVEKEAFRQRLCDLSGIDYEPGFCTDCSFNLGPDLEVCAGTCITLEAPDFTDASFVWSTGETSRIIEVCPEITTDYFVEITTADGCIASDTITILTLEAPAFDLGDDMAVCTGETVLIEGPDQPDLSYQWFVDGVLQTDVTTPFLEVFVADTLMVKLIVTGINDCSRADSISVFAWDLPVISLNPEMADMCIGEDLELNASIQFADSFEWWNGSSQTTTNFTATEPGAFALWLNAINGFGCTASDTVFVTVHPEPVFLLEFFESSSPVCFGESITIAADLSNTVDAQKLVWNQTDTVVVNGQEIIYKELEITNSTVITATVITTFGCVSSNNLNVEVVSLPEIVVPDATSVCFGSTVILEASGGASCSWYDQDGLISNGYVLEILPQQTSYYRAVITGDIPPFCQTSDSVLVTVYPKPEIVIEASETTVCSGTAIDLAASGALSYNWSNGMSGSTINVIPATDTIFKVIGVSEEGCVDSAFISISVLPVPEAILSGLLSAYCQNDSEVEMVGFPDGGSFSGPGTSGNIFNPGIAGPGMHQIVYTVDGENGCFGHDTSSVRVLPFELSIDLGADTTLCPHDSIILDAGEGFSHYFWSNGAITQVVTIMGKNYLPGLTHQIQVAGTLNGCSATGKILLTIRDDCYIGIDETSNKAVFDIVPNPGRDFFQLHFYETFLAPQLEIFDMTGKSVWKMKYPTAIYSGEVLDINLDLKTGNYLIVFSSERKRLTKKIVIQ